MHILFLAHFYPPEMGGASARLHGLSRMLVKHGHQVTVITGFPNYPEGRFYEGYKGKAFGQETVDGVRVVRTWIYTSPKRGGLRRLANYFSFVLSSIVAGFRISGFRVGGSFDVVVASSPPLFIGISGVVLARKLRCPFVFDIRDIWPELAVEAGEFAPDAKIVRLGEALERWLYRRANHITVVTDRKRSKLLNKGLSSEKISVIANGVDLDRLTDIDFDWREHLGIQSKFVALYAGLIGVFQGVEVVAKAAKELQDYDDIHTDDIHIVIVGDGVKRAEIATYIADHELPNISLLPAQPKEQIPAMLRSFDLSLVPLVNENLVDAVPSKLLEAMGCRCPVLLIAGGEARRVIEESQAGVVVRPGSSTELAEAILTFSKLEVVQKNQYAQNGFDYICRNHDRSELAKQLEQVLLNIIQPRTK